MGRLLSLKLPRPLVVILLSLLSSLIWTKALMMSQERLYDSEHWLPYNALYFGARLNAYEEFFTRRFVAENRLRSLVDHKKHRLASKDENGFETLSIKAQITSHGMISIMTMDKDRMTGVRIARNPLHTSQWFEADHHDRIIRSIPIPVQPDHDVQVTLKNTPEGLSVFIDGKEVLQGAPQLPPGRIGLEIFDATLDPPVITANQETTRMDFIASGSFLVPFLLNFAFIALISLLFPIRFSYAVLAFGLYWVIFDATYYRNRKFFLNYPLLRFERDQSTFLDYEVLRQNVFGKWHELTGGKLPDPSEVKKKFPFFGTFSAHLCQTSGCKIIPPGSPIDTSPFSKDGIRLLVIGGSSSAGWGATIPWFSYTARLTYYLNQDMKAPPIYLLSFPLRTSPIPPALRGELFRVLNIWKPDLVVYDIFPNLTDFSAMDETLAHFKEAGTPAVLIRSPVYLTGMYPRELEFVKNYVEKEPVRDEPLISVFFQ